MFEMPGATESPFGSLNGLAADNVDGTGYFFTNSINLTGFGGSISAWSGDGMLLGQVYPGTFTGPMGWPDRINSLSLLRMPGDAPDVRRLCMEDDGASRICTATLNGVDPAMTSRTAQMATWPPIPGEQAVEISAVVPTATEHTPGRIRFTRIGNNVRPRTVNYAVRGSAIAGRDYSEMLSGSIVIPAGESSIDLTITPMAHAEVRGDSLATLTLLARGAEYTLSKLAVAEVRIVEENPGPMLSVLATVPNTSKATAAGNFRIGRNGSSGNLTVYYRLSGTAGLGADYTTPLPASAQIPDGADHVDVPITALLDAPDQPSLSVTLTLLAARAGYTLDTSPGKKTADTVMIANARLAPSPQIYWNFGVDKWDPNPTSHDPHLSVSPISGGASAIMPRHDEHGYSASLNGWDLRRQSYTFKLSVEDGYVLSLTDWSMRWAAQNVPGTLSLEIDGMSVGSAPYPALNQLAANPTRFELTHVVLRPGEHAVRILCSLPQGPSALMDDLTFNGTMVAQPSTIVALLSAPSHDPNVAAFTVTRFNAASQPMSVFYTLTGATADGKDASIPGPSGSVEIAAGQSTAALNFDPAKFGFPPTVRSIVDTLTPDRAYRIVPSADSSQAGRR